MCEYNVIVLYIDAGATVLKLNEKFNEAMKDAAAELNLRRHVVGRNPDRTTDLHAAVDVEGHIGMDNRFYLLDLSRTFPPESPIYTQHLNVVYPDGANVNIVTDSNEIIKATVHKAYPHGQYYDLIFDDGTIVHKCAAESIQHKGLSIYWRFLR